MHTNTAILLIHCPDSTGIVRAVTDFLFENNGNIVDLEQHTETASQQFFMRIEWQLDKFQILPEKINEYFETLIARKYSMKWQLHFTSKVQRMAIFVSKLSHCLYDMLYRHHAKEWKVEIPLIISNHEELSTLARQFEIPFYHFKIRKENKLGQEQKQLDLMKHYQVDLVVFARYMQIVTENFIAEYPNRIINIHHSFLPAFVGAKPYHAAHERGVKIIGATAHYVTEELDAGPIITQDVAHVSHKEDVADLIKTGKDIEKMVLSKAVEKHLNHKVLSYGNRTIVFD